MDTVTKQISEREATVYVNTFVETLIENRALTGLELNIEIFMINYLENKEPADELTRQLYVLMECLFIDDAKKTEDVLRYFIGRGTGSTPAGDDHVIGLIAIHTITNALHPTFVHTVKKLTEREEITTRVGHYYLHHALHGTFLDLIARILHDMTNHKQHTVKNKLIDLLPIGHSSGIDTSFGMLLGMLAIIKQKNK